MKVQNTITDESTPHRVTKKSSRFRICLMWQFQSPIPQRKPLELLCFYFSETYYKHHNFGQQYAQHANVALLHWVLKNINLLKYQWNSSPLACCAQCCPHYCVFRLSEKRFPVYIQVSSHNHRKLLKQIQVKIYCQVGS